MRLHPWHHHSTHPAVRSWHNEWAASLQNRAADAITRFSGSMGFVYLHIVWFTVWLIFKLNIDLLTMIVSLEAIFLATFVLISQNRADVKRSAIADHDHEVDCEALTRIKRIEKHLGVPE